MPLQATSGAASYDAFGGGVAAVPNYIEDVFSTYLYTGNGSTQTITNGIDLSTYGGLTWLKRRDSATGGNHNLFDTARGVGNYINSNTTSAQANDSTTLTAWSTTGFSLGASTRTNTSAATYASWTFRKQPKFFDVVTFTQTSTSSNFRVNHSLGSVPGCIIIKCTSTTSGWYVYHRSLGRSQYMRLEATSNAASSTDIWGTSDPTSTDFGINAGGLLEGVGTTYVAYLFAHNAGGFGLTGTDNVISCGSYVGNGSTPNNVTLGYEPQWILIKDITGSTNPWVVVDNMRGMSLTNRVELYPNTSGAELTSATNRLSPTATGFFLNGDNSYYNTNGSTYIYIAIRRGPMKVPTDATKVFKPVARSGTGSTATITAGFPVDLEISKTKTNPGPYGWFDRLRGATLWLTSSGTNAEATASDSLTSFASNTGVIAGADLTGLINYGSDTYANWMFQRAPSFMDVVCYTGTGANQVVTHNLGVVPELIIIKARTDTTSWNVYASSIGSGKRLFLETTGAVNTLDGYAALSSTTFTTGVSAQVCGAGNNFVAYLFATCAGVSKVGSYTGTGTTQQINCGFTGGARFVLIKRTNSTGDWYVWDSARGIVAGNDPYLLLNTTGVDVTNTDYVDTYSAGFEISSTAPAAINGSGSTFIFLAIA